tara:strand:+ start:1739 stop:3532 length:1794 start_codon:yes stop_codon:yes gene_type:complete
MKTKTISYLIAFVFIFNAFFFLSLNQSDNSESCIENLYLEQNQIEVLEQNNKKLIKNQKIIYLELDLIPEINGIICLGQEIDLTNLHSNVIATSNKIFKIYLFFTLIFITWLFVQYKRNSILTYILLILVNQVLIYLIFFSRIKYDYFIFSALIAILLYYFLLYKKLATKEKISLLDYFIFLNVLTLFFDYNFFTQISIILILVYIRKFQNFNLDQNQFSILKYSVLIYFFLRLITGLERQSGNLWQSLSNGMYRGSSIFPDMIYVFRIFNCKNNPCGNDYNVYGPVLEYIKFYNNPILSTQIVSVLAITYLIYFINSTFNSNKKASLFFFYLFLSSPITFAIERMNIDVIIFIIFYLSVKYLIPKYKFLSMLIISLLIQIKMYPIFLLIGLLVGSFISKNKRELTIYFLTFFLNTIFLVWYILNVRVDENIPNPYGISWTYGIPSHFMNYLEITNNSFLVGILFILSLIVGIIYFSPQKINDFSTETIFNDHIVSSFLITFLLTSFYFNFDYRLILFIFVVPKLLQNIQISRFHNTILVFLVTSVSPFYYQITEININIAKSLFPLFFIVVNHVSFYILFLMTFFLYYKKTFNQYD